MKEHLNKAHPRYPRLIESHWDSTIEFERLSINPTALHEGRNSMKEIEINIDSEGKYLMEEIKISIDSSTEVESNLYPPHKKRDHIINHWDSDIELERLSFDPTTESSHKDRNHLGDTVKVVGIVNILKEKLTAFKVGFIIMLIATILFLLGECHFFGSAIKKRPLRNKSKKRRSQDTSPHNSCSPTKRKRIVPEAKRHTEIISIAGNISPYD